MNNATPTTVPAMLKARALASPQQVAFHYKQHDQWCSLTWSDYWQQANHIAAQLQQQGVQPGESVVIILPTSLEWELIDKAALMIGAVVVGIEPHAPPEHMTAILQQCQADIWVVADTALAERLSDAPKPKLIISLDPNPPASATPTLAWDTLLNEPTSALQPEYTGPGPDEPAALIFTSGTTGAPKAILYTHQQVVTACDAIQDRFQLQASDQGICWLPLANLFQRIVNLCLMQAGGSSHIVDDPQQIMTAITELKPTFFIGVPRVYEKISKGIQAQLGKLPRWPRQCLNYGLNQAIAYHRHTTNNETPTVAMALANRLLQPTLLAKFRAALGGNLRFIVSGSAPCPEWITHFFNSMGIPLLEAYGISENIVPVCANSLTESKPGSVGKPLKSNQVKLADDGEVLVKGPGLFRHYGASSTQPAALAEDSLTADGFYRTSDFGHFDAHGFLYLTGRKSDLIKSSTGRRISLTKVETALSQAAEIDQVMVYGANRKGLVALISLADPQPHTPETTAALANSLATASAGLAAYEQIHAALILAAPLTIEAKELTPNLKIRRQFVADKYQPELDQLYTELSEQPTDAESNPTPMIRYQ